MLRENKMLKQSLVSDAVYARLLASLSPVLIKEAFDKSKKEKLRELKVEL
jgi:hypothetical protein